MQSNGKPEPELNDGFEQGGWQVPWNNSMLLQGDVAGEVAALKRQLIHPVVLGSGQRLFADGTTPAALELTGTTTTSRGVVVHIHQPSGTPEYGSVAPEQHGGVVKDSMSRPAAT